MDSYDSLFAILNNIVRLDAEEELLFKKAFKPLLLKRMIIFYNLLR